ncbi:MAG: hypothetical protein QT02_C0001G0108 [archaeon GW2011_AR9]|nr:MAG: hypothetical protein QT02_C0001G0108 [archaeon GW2011_AR9]
MFLSIANQNTILLLGELLSAILSMIAIVMLFPILLRTRKNLRATIRFFIIAICLFLLIKIIRSIGVVFGLGGVYGWEGYFSVRLGIALLNIFFIGCIIFGITPLFKLINGLATPPRRKKRN